MLLTDNRNLDSQESLEATLRDSWHEGSLPVLTLAHKRRFDDDRAYAERVAIDIAEVLYGLSQEQHYRDQPRIFVPFQ